MRSVVHRWRSWLRPNRWRFRHWLLIAGLYFLGYGLLIWVWRAFGGADLIPGSAVVIGNVLAWPSAWFAIKLGLLARFQPSERLRWVWSFLVLTVVMWLGSGAIWSLYWVLTAEHAPLPSLAEPLHLAGQLLTLSAVLAFPLGMRGRLGRLRLFLDVGILSVALLVLGWVLLLQPVLRGARLGEIETFWTAVYPTLDLLILVLLANVFLVLEPNDLRSALGLIGIGALLLALADLAYTFLDLRGQLGLNDTSAWFDLGRVAAFVIIGLAARWQLWPRPNLNAFPAPPTRWLAPAQSLLPLAAAIALVWYVVLDWQSNGQPNLFGVGASVALALALVARQGVLSGELELSQYAQLVTNAADPAFICDVEGRLTLANPALLAALRYPSTQTITGQSLMALFSAPVLMAQHALTLGELLREAALTGWSGEVVLKRQDGSEFPADVALRPVRSALPGRAVLAGTAHDLSEQKDQQAALRRAYEEVVAARRALEDLNQQLEYKVAEKTQHLTAAYLQLEKQNDDLHALDQLKSEFVSLVSHELRAPLTNIAGGVEVALARGELPQRAVDTLALVQAEIRRLTRFVETILDLSALDAGRLPLTSEPLDVVAVVAVVRAHFAARADGDRLHIALPIPLPLVLADERALTSVLFHLVDNAFKYAPTGGIELQARATDSALQLTVSDHGPGIQHAQRERVFAMFQRLHNDDARDVYGHGLGLYMAKRLLTALNGDIQVADAPSGGAQFVVTLPLAEGW